MSVEDRFPTQGRNWRLGRVHNCPPSFWQNRRLRRTMAVRRITTQLLVASYAPVSTTYLHSEKLVHNVQFGIINITEYWYHANRLPIYELDTLYYITIQTLIK